MKTIVDKAPWDKIYINLAAFDQRQAFIPKLTIQTYFVYYI